MYITESSSFVNLVDFGSGYVRSIDRSGRLPTKVLPVMKCDHQKVRPNPDKMPAGGKEVHPPVTRVPLFLSKPVLNDTGCPRLSYSNR